MPVYTRGMREKGLHLEENLIDFGVPNEDTQQHPLDATRSNRSEDYGRRSNHTSPAASVATGWSRSTGSSRARQSQIELEKNRELTRLEEEADVAQAELNRQSIAAQAELNRRSIERRKRLVEQEALYYRILEEENESNRSESPARMRDVEEELEILRQQQLISQSPPVARRVHSPLQSAFTRQQPDCYATDAVNAPIRNNLQSAFTHVNMNAVNEPLPFATTRPNDGWMNQPLLSPATRRLQDASNMPVSAVPGAFDGLANALMTAINSAKPKDEQNSGDMRKFLARQTGGKDLPLFSGEPEDWPSFHSIFKKSTEVCGYSDEENLMRLLKALKGKAKESVQSMLDSSCRISEVMDVLEKRFGRPQAIIKSMIEKVKNTTAPTEKNFEALIDFSVAVKNLCATAENLKLPQYLNNPTLMEELVQKLPHHLQLDWGFQVIKARSQQMNLQDFSEFLDVMSSAAVVVCDIKKKEDQEVKKTSGRCSALVVENTQQPQGKKCLLGCAKYHKLQYCATFKAMTPSERYSFVLEKRLCFSCLGSGHSVFKCREKVVCGVDGCTRNHNKQLHIGETTHKREEQRQNDRDEEDSGHVSGVISEAKNDVLAGSVIMIVVPVTLHGPKGVVKANAFLDEGSSVTMLDAEVAEKLGLQGKPGQLNLSWLNSCSRMMDSKHVNVKIQGCDKNSREFFLNEVRTVNNLNLPIQPVSNCKLWKRWKHLEGVPYPEVINSKPVILIGQDNIDLTMPRKIVEGPKNAPVATLTKLGWVVHGRNYIKECHDSGFSFVSIHNQDDLLQEMVKDNFKLDSLGIMSDKSLPKSKDDIRAERMMDKMSKRVDNCWETGMLWKSDETVLPPSKHAAARRLKILEKQMDEDPLFAELYCAKIDEYVQKGFCRKLTPEEAADDNGKVWYLPHFGTRNPNKPGKLRLVFDCAAKCKGTSLNDALLQGPDLLCPLIAVLAKFRQREVAFSGDIRDMFHMVRIRQEDLPALRFLWRGSNRNISPETWTMQVMVFGSVTSPYQAQYIKNKNAEEFRSRYPDAVDAIQNRHYVDDYLDSTRTEEDAIVKIMQVREVHKQGGFEIRNWLCSSTDVLKVVDPGSARDLDNHGLASLELQADEKLERVLGLHWDPKADVFKFKTTFRTVDHSIIDGGVIPTKRQILKLVMCLFDPLGFLGHFTVRAKILIQDIWRIGLGWDQEIVASLIEKWKKIVDQISSIPHVRIPRCYGPKISDAKDVQLHVFCDASEQAYCAVAYLRVTGRGGEVNVNIVIAKSRVSPLRPTSIPRLELQAALVGSRLTSFVKENHDLNFNSITLWTDSRNVLCWIRAEDPRRFKPYVAHRIGEIQEHTDSSMWKWIPTALNPADDGTRDVTSADMTSTARWFIGPEFLKKPVEEWPTETKECLPTSDLELKTEFVGVIQQQEMPLDEGKFSDWFRLIRVTAWILRFASQITPNSKRKSGTLTVKEIKAAELLWIKKCQTDNFSDELNLLQQETPIKKESKLLSLSPTLKDGVIVVNSRIVKSSTLSEETKFPVILDAKHTWTKLLVDSYHREMGHHGNEMICNELRQKYWILGLRQAVKDASKRCFKCKEERAKVLPPQMAALPDFRVSRPPRPFSYVGVDYFGPIEVTILRRKIKRWGALFTCLSTRAVHLEVAYSLSTDGLLTALERFICRRGEPIEVWSDNGTNFQGADHELKKCVREMDHFKIQDKLSRRKIIWNFIPPGAPHMGGAWERLVRSVKIAMSSVMKNASLTDELLQTVFAEAEATVNSRPLTLVSLDKDDTEAITPNCFLLGTTSIKQPPGNFTDGDLSTRKKWRITQVIADHFWRRWTKEYLPSLSLRRKWRMPVPDLKVGDLVFIVDSNELRNKWTKGIVDAVYPGEDGQVRVADVRTASGTLRRPVVKLLRMDMELE